MVGTVALSSLRTLWTVVMAVMDLRDVYPREIPGFHGRGGTLFVLSIVFVSIAVVLVAVRVSTRFATMRELGKDDYFILLATVFDIGLTIVNCISVRHGYGAKSNSLSKENLNTALRGFWAIQILYKFTINMTKVSILCLYLRIFPNKTFRKAAWIVMFFVVGYAASSILATIFQCTPLSKTFRPQSPGKCLNLTAFWYSNAVANILGDCAILALPMPVLYALHLPQRQKFGLMMVFAIGFFVCITSILRMTTLDQGSKAHDQTYGTYKSTIWTTVECNTGIVCACLPMMKAPLTWLFPKLFPQSIHEIRACPTKLTCVLHRTRKRNSGWNLSEDRKENNRGSSTVVPVNSSREEMIGMDTITKTTEIQVDFADQDRSPTSSTMTDKEATMQPSILSLPQSHYNAHGLYPPQKPEKGSFSTT